MPIHPRNKDRYPKDWKDIRASILERAKNKCEFCGVQNHSFHKREKVVRIVLTVAHLDHMPENNLPNNLKALCQKCHLDYDREHHQKSRKENKRLDLKDLGQQTLLLTPTTNGE